MSPLMVKPSNFHDFTYFIDIVTKETRMGVSMNEASSTPKAMNLIIARLSFLVIG